MGILEATIQPITELSPITTSQLHSVPSPLSVIGTVFSATAHTTTMITKAGFQV